MTEKKGISERIDAILNANGRVSDHAGDPTDEGIQADLANLCAAVSELQHAVVTLAAELDSNDNQAGERPPPS